MPAKALIGAGAAFVLPLALTVGVTLQTTTDNAAASTDPNAGAIGGGLKPGSAPAAYAPWIEKAAGACPGLPAPVLAAQLHQESGFQPSTTSAAGAQGIAQFMPGTADAMGLLDPFDPGAAINAQAHLMRDLLGRFGSVPLALAAYNAGPGAVAACGCIPPFPETRAYVTKILGLLGGAGDVAMGELEVRLVH